MTPALELRDLFRIYGAPEGASVALQGLTLTVAEGEIVVVLGPSGSGKSTLLRIAAGLDAPSAGVARTVGVELAKLRPAATATFRARHLGILDQHYARSLSPELTCRENVGLRLALLGHDRTECDERALALLERVGLRDRADDLPHALSGGEQQRVAVCAALVHRPPLLLADEPGGELDAVNAEAVYALVRELARELGSTALVVSHDPGATAIADRLVTIRDGRLGEEAEPGGPGRLVVARGGWLRLPGSLRHRAGIGAHATARSTTEGLLLEPAGEAPDAAPEPAAVPRAASGAEVVAELRDVEKRYDGGSGSSALQGVDGAFHAGRLTLVVGRSGSGKTTLLNLLAGLVRPSAGEVLVLDRRLAQLSRTQLADLRREHVGVVGQEPGLVPFLSARENVALALALHRGEAKNGSEAADEALAAVALEHRADQRVSRLSAGERQRVAVARALAHRPRLLLTDEPTARLDEDNARATASLLLRAARGYGAAVVCATHDPALLELGDEQVQLD
jgi:ABC-type lipoprotein export system ATPase subunit